MACLTFTRIPIHVCDAQSDRETVRIICRSIGYYIVCIWVRHIAIKTQKKVKKTVLEEHKRRDAVNIRSEVVRCVRRVSTRHALSLRHSQRLLRGESTSHRAQGRGEILNDSQGQRSNVVKIYLLFGYPV